MENKPIVTLLHHTPLHIASHAIRKCWDSGDKSDTYMIDGEAYHETPVTHGGMCDTLGTGPKDRELIHRVGNKFKHASTLEHLHMTWSISGETTDELVTYFKEDSFSTVSRTNDTYIVTTNVRALQSLNLEQEIILQLLPESYKYLFELSEQ